MIIKEKIGEDINNHDQEKLQKALSKLLSYKEKYSQEELRSILNFIENPGLRYLYQKILLD